MKLLKLTNRILEVIIITILATMSCLIFLNVILRYGFSSGIAITEELSRYLFVWLTFVGAVLAFKENLHVSVQSMVERLPAKLQSLIGFLTEALMLFCCYLIFLGSWKQAGLNMQNYLPISGLPTGLLYSAGIFVSVGIGLILITRLLVRISTLYRAIKSH